MSYQPEYVLSDNGHNLVKATTSLELPHHKDIGHTFGLFLEDAYGGDAEFNEFRELMRKARLKYLRKSTFPKHSPNNRNQEGIC